MDSGKRSTAIGKKQKHREDGEGNGRWAKDSSAINLDQFTNFDRYMLMLLLNRGLLLNNEHI